MSHDHYIQKFQCGHVHSQCRCASREKREIVVPKNCPDCSTVVPVSRDTPRPMSALDQRVVEARREYDDALLARSNADPRTVIRVMNAYRALEAAFLTTHRSQVLAEVEEKLRAEADARGEYEPQDGLILAADFVASLRDTREGT